MSFSKFCIIISIYFLLMVTIQNHVFGVFRVSGDSMLPNVQDKNFKVVNHMVKKYERGDIVVAKDYKNKVFIVKRVIGLPGEKVDIVENKVYINGEKLNEPYLDEKYNNADDCIGNVRLNNDEYYLLGDNRGDSVDSRSLGPFKNKDIIGRCF
ncbi:signal peptidase I [Peptoniphilus rhinitidis]|uniref:signal peptidase I n=1 Tax=Peptoniphilus rhinitidis TaxID=1175452 RepID=UPI0013051202|nr:signal peptidase I [Peptoniphilus rhinitidis]